MKASFNSFLLNTFNSFSSFYLFQLFLWNVFSHQIKTSKHASTFNNFLFSQQSLTIQLKKTRLRVLRGQCIPSAQNWTVNGYKTFASLEFKSSYRAKNVHLFILFFTAHAIIALCADHALHDAHFIHADHAIYARCALHTDHAIYALCALHTAHALHSFIHCWSICFKTEKA